jgi:beta-glucosidase
LSLTEFVFSDLQWHHLPAGGDSTVTVTIKNTGGRVGAEVAMLFVQLPVAAVAAAAGATAVSTPRLQLQGFQKPFLAVGESRTLSYRLVPRQLSVAQPDGSWKLAAGKVTVSVGGHQPAEPGQHTSNVVSVVSAV